jgi:hypothetical protein
VALDARHGLGHDCREHERRRNSVGDFTVPTSGTVAIRGAGRSAD